MMTDSDMAAPIDGWAAFCDALRSSGDAILRSAEGADPLSQAEALRYLTRLLRSGIEKFVEYSDENDPYLANVYNDRLKWGLDNPDSLYAMSYVDGGKEYEISGNIGSVHYFNFTSAIMSTTAKYDITGILDHPDVESDADGNFIVHVGGAERDRNWVRLAPESNSIMVRQTFADRRHEAEMSFSIREVSGIAGARSPLTMTQSIARLEKAGAFFTNTSRTFTKIAAMMAKDTNLLPPVDQNFMLSMGGDPNYAYFWAAFRIEPDEALLIHFPDVPDTDTWNLCLYNYWLESLDYTRARILINKSTAVFNADGSLTIVVSHAPPDTATEASNWLDVLGHRSGNIMSRWTNPKGGVRPQTELVRLDSVNWAEKMTRWPESG